MKNHIVKILQILALFSVSSMVNASSEKSAAKRVLIVTTSHAKLGNTGKETGYYLGEVTHPYEEFVKAGYTVHIASIQGGKAPLDPSSLDLKDKVNAKLWANKGFRKKLDNTKKLSKVTPSNYKAILFAGGHGTMWDFPNSESVDSVARSIYENGGVVGAVCHGPAALVGVKLSNGDPLVKGKKVTAFSDKEEELVKLTEVVPFLLEGKLTKLGAKVSVAQPWTENVVRDQRVVTGQNPQSAAKVAREIIQFLNKNS